MPALCLAESPWRGCQPLLQCFAPFARGSPGAWVVPRQEVALEFEEGFFASQAKGAEFGRCGGRELQSRMEREICDKLSRSGVPHSHRPRRFEVKLDGNRVASYSPSIVLRGRGREGKTVVIELLSSAEELRAKKLRAFHELYRQDFYVMCIAAESVLAQLDGRGMDAGIPPTEVDDLINRLAE